MMSIGTGSSTVLERLAAVRQTGSLELAVAAGEAVLDEVCANDLEGWRARGGSLRRLAASTGLSASTVYRYVAVAAMLRALGRPRFTHLGSSHLRQVLPLRRAQQLELLTRAEAELWTVARLRRAVAFEEPERVRGRPPAPAFLRAFAQLERWSELRDRMDGLEHLGRMAQAEQDRMLQVVVRAQMDLEMLETRLRLAARNRRVA